MKRVVIYIPGLGDQNTLVLGYQKLALKLWRLRGVRVEVMQMFWSSKEPFKNRFQELIARIDELDKKDFSVSVVGVSAGASAALLAMLHSQAKVQNVVTICGKLQGTVSPLLQKANPRFGTSYGLLQTAFSTISESEKSRVFTIYSSFDYYVSKSQATLPGMREKDISIPGHNLACALILLIGARTITKFLKSKKL